MSQWYITLGGLIRDCEILERLNLDIEEILGGRHQECVWLVKTFGEAKKGNAEPTILILSNYIGKSSIK